MPRLTLEDHLSAAALARHWVCGQCPDEHLPAARRWVAELLTSELVVNAVEHGSGPFTLTLTHDTDGIVVGISDGSTALPSLRSQRPGATSGRGIALVDALATAWGSYPSAVAGPRGTAAVDPALPVLTDGDPLRPAAGAAPGPAAPGGTGKTVWFHLSTG